MIVVLLDSLNRHDLGCYGGADFETPNLDRFAQRATRFDRHVTGSLPCMPARHDILCGTLDFLWRPWGSIELWEEPITAPLRRADVVTMLVTDHPHLFETGGENYHTDFLAWDYLRGHEGDPWKTSVDPSWTGAPALPARDGSWWIRRRHDVEGDRASDRSRTWFRAEADFPGPKVMAAAAEWLKGSALQHRAEGRRWLLFVDEFDPHEPFDTPPPWAGRYDDRWDDDLIIWPPYAVGPISDGHLTAREGHQVRANYGAKLSMIDHWFGTVVDALDEHHLWETTAVIVCTDHGHYLGDIRHGRDIWGKPSVPQYEPLGHTPLLIHWPGIPGGGVVDALTTNVDLHATLCDVFGVDRPEPCHGQSLAGLLGGQRSVRDWAIGGVYGNWVQVTDGRYKYARAPAGDPFPLSLWSNRWSTMPVHVPGYGRLPRPDGRARLDTMPGTDVPVIRQPFGPGDHLPFWVNPRSVDRHELFDVHNDPDETRNLAGSRSEHDLIELLRTALIDLQAPAEQFERLGIG